MVDDAKFCKSCGKNLANVAPSKPSSRPQSQSSHTLAIVLGYVFSVLIPLVGIIFAIYLFTRRDSSSARIHGTVIIIIAVVIWILGFLFA